MGPVNKNWQSLRCSPTKPYMEVGPWPTEAEPEPEVRPY